MKKIFKLMLLPAMALPLLFTSCSDDNGSNPTLDLSHTADGFVLNLPAYATNNTYDLASAESLTLTCSQPNYGGIPYVTRYYVQVAIDQKFVTDTTAAHTELATSYTAAKLSVDASELNSTLVDMYQSANPDTSIPESMPVYVRLRAVIDGTTNSYLGQTYSNTITLPSVKATYKAPDASYPENLFVVGSSIQTAWSSWKEVPPVYGLSGNYYTMVYVPAGGSFKWGTYENDWRGYSRFTSVNDQAGAGLSEDGDGNIKVANSGWYVLHFVGEMSSDKKNINYSLNVYPGAAYVIGAPAGGAWTDADANWAMTAPADQTGEWVSPAFTAAGELRAYIKVQGIDWWRTEFTINSGKCYWRAIDIPDNWAANVGDDYSVACSAGQKLYVNFDTNTAEVK
jgi:starch-binding outer membrane protein SusE/F